MEQKKSRFSVIMTVYEQAQELEKNLPAYLNQRYDSDYEIIVVDESSTDNSEDVLKLLKNEYAHLYSTFLPKPDRNVIRRRLAFTLGVKASKYEWVIFTDINYTPTSSRWLDIVAGFTDSNTEMVLGYTKNTTMRFQQFSHLDEAQKRLQKAERRKADGHKGNHLKCLRGKYDFVAIRKEQAHEALKLFDIKINGLQLLSLRLGVIWQGLLHNFNTTKIKDSGEEPTE